MEAIVCISYNMGYTIFVAFYPSLSRNDVTRVKIGYKLWLP